MRTVKEFTKRSAESKAFIHSLRQERGMVLRDIPTLRGRGIELLLNYNWIIKGWAVLGVATQEVFGGFA